MKLEEQRRRTHITDYAARIERLRVMQALADGNADFKDHERRSMAQEIIDLRRTILDKLSTTELSELQRRKLSPEQAIEVIRDEPPPRVDPEIRKVHDDIRRENFEAWAAQGLFVAEKGFSFTPTPGVSILDQLKALPEQRDLLKKWTPPKLPSKAATISPTDAYNNHMPKRRD